MARNLKAKITLEADTKKADKALKGTAKQMGVVGTAAAGLRTGLNSLKTAFAGVGIAAIALFAALGKIISLANEQEDAVRKLNASLQNLDGSNEALSQSLQKQAAALAAVTTASDEQVLSVQAKIALFVKDEEQIKAITRVSLDFAAATGQDVVAAADLITKTFASSTNSLTRYGFEVEGAAGSTARLDSLLQAMTRTQGQAEAAVGTTSGQIGLMTDAFLDAVQAIGAFITRTETAGSVLTFLTDLFNKVEGGLTQMKTALDSTAGAFSLIAESVLPDFIAKLIGVDGAAQRFVDTEQKLRNELIKQGAAAKEAAQETKGLEDAQTAAADAAKLLAGEEESVTKQLEALGVVLESTVQKEILRLNDLLDSAREKFRTTGQGADQLAATEILVTRAIDKLNVSLATQGGVLLETSVETDTYTRAIDLATVGVDRLTAAEIRNADVVIRSAQQRTAARQSELSQNLLGGQSTFGQIGGGTFTQLPAVTTGANGRVTVAFAAASIANEIARATGQT